MTDNDLLAPLRAEPPGHSRLDVPKAMADGARLRRRRQWTTGVTAATAVVLVAVGGAAVASGLRPKPAPQPVAPLPTACAVTELPTADGSRTDVVAGDPTGYLIGEQTPKGAGRDRPIIWNKGVIVARPTGTGADAQFRDINRNGIAVGTGIVNHEDQAYAIVGGRIVPLPGDVSSAAAINDAGTVVGSNEKAVGIHRLPVRWSSVGAAPEKLPLPPGMGDGVADGITEDGTIWGTTDVDSRHDPIATVWLPDGTVRQLALTAQAGERERRFGISAITSGWAYGTVSTITSAGWPGVGYRARYNLAKNAYEQLPAVATDSYVYGANGWIFGEITDRSAQTAYPVILAGRAVVRLPEPDRGATARYGLSAISPDGRTIAGTAIWRDKNALVDVPLLWRCH
jgi:hypothetical protein